MIFKRGKRGSNDQEPQTKSEIFNPADKKATSSGLPQNKSQSFQDKGAQAEPPTRDAIFNDAPLNIKSQPPTGWAAVIAGPEKGKIISLGYGETELDLSGVSATQMINFNSESQIFSLQGEGPEQVLNGHETFKIGKHSLFIVPLCAGGFD